jgi:hypothetical protein
MLLRLTVAAHVVAKIVTRETDFSIAADAQSVASGVVHHAVCSIALSHSGHTHEYGYESEYKSFHNKLCGYKRMQRYGNSVFSAIPNYNENDFYYCRID